MNELDFVSRLRQHLNRGLHELPPPTLNRLASARQRALARQKVALRQSVLSTAGSFVQHLQQQLEGRHLKQLFLGLLIVFGIAGYTYWSADQSIAEIEAIDSALLADELPIEAFTDRGFAVWLKSSAPQ